MKPTKKNTNAVRVNVCHTDVVFVGIAEEEETGCESFMNSSNWGPSGMDAVIMRFRFGAVEGGILALCFGVKGWFEKRSRHLSLRRFFNTQSLKKNGNKRALLLVL